MKDSKLLEEEESFNAVASIAKAYPIAREKCVDNAKWESFKTALKGLCSGIY